MISVLVAIYKRPRITGVMMRHYRRMADKRNDLLLVAVGSEGDESRRLATDNGWEYVEAPNNPVSNKLDAGTKLIKKMNPSGGILAMGSDDMVTEPWVDLCAASGSMLGIKDMYLLRTLSWEAVHWPGYEGPRKGESIGAHRFFPRSLLVKLNWSLWPFGLNKGLDGNLTKKIQKTAPGFVQSARVLSMQDAGCAALGIQSELNITPWKDILRLAKLIPPQEVIQKFPEETRAEVMKLRS